MKKRHESFRSELANTFTQIVRLHGGKLEDVAKGIGGTLVSPPLDVRGVEQYFVNVEQRFPPMDDLLEILVLIVRTAFRPEPLALNQIQQRQHNSAATTVRSTVDEEHLPTILGKLFDDVRRNRCLVMKTRRR